MKIPIWTSAMLICVAVAPALAGPNNGGFPNDGKNHAIQMHEDTKEHLTSVLVDGTAVAITINGVTSTFNLGFVASVGQINDWTAIGPRNTTFLDPGSDKMIFTAIRTGGKQTDTAVAFTSDVNLGESLMDIEFRTQGKATYTITSADENGKAEIPEPPALLLMATAILALSVFATGGVWVRARRYFPHSQ